MVHLPKELVAIITDYKRQFEIADHVIRMASVNSQIRNWNTISKTVRAHVQDAWDEWVASQHTRAEQPHVYAPDGTWQDEMVWGWWLNLCLKKRGVLEA